MSTGILFEDFTKTISVVVTETMLIKKHNFMRILFNIFVFESGAKVFTSINLDGIN